MIYDVWVTETYNALVRVEAEDDFDAQDKADAFASGLDPAKMRFAERVTEVDAGYEPGTEKDNHVDIDLTRKEECHEKSIRFRGRGMETTIRLYEGAWYINGYGIAGNPDDGYTVWCEADGMDSDTLYEDRSFEKCVTWCMNS